MSQAIASIIDSLKKWAAEPALTSLSADDEK